MGHGETVKEESQFGHFADKDGWDRLVEDVHILQNQIKEEYTNIPYVVMGHSMGSLVVRTYVTKYKDDIDGIIISGTSGQVKGLSSGKMLIKLMKGIKGKKYKSKLVEYLITGSFNRKFKHPKTKSDWTSRDEKSVEKYVKDPKCGKNFTLQAYEDLLNGTQYLSKEENIIDTPNVPILIFSGEKDPVGENGKGVKRVYEMLRDTGKSNITLKLFPDGRHEMLNETNKEEVYQYILHWLQENIYNF